MADNDPQMKLRLPPELKALIEETARKNKRSMNAEIVDRLEISFSLKEIYQHKLGRAVFDSVEELSKKNIPASDPEAMSLMFKKMGETIKEMSEQVNKIEKSS